MNELINDVQWLACVLLFICAICDANDDLGAYTACRYSYDSVGNRVEKDCDGQKTRYAYNSLDQLTEEQTATGPKTTYRWDGRGNLLEKSTPAQTIRYEWSSDNRLLKASDGSTSIRYGYDALGRRISRTQETSGQKQETQWILDTARPYSEIVLERSRQNGGAWQETRYTHTPDGVGQLISEQRQGKTLHVYEDGQGSARLITDESGQIIETLDFDAFGNEEAGNPQESRHRYTGESYDSATGLYHLRARDYDPKTGRFISMDEHPGSQSIPLTLNKYLYGNADPVNHVDPSGNFSLVMSMPSFNLNMALPTAAYATSILVGGAVIADPRNRKFSVWDAIVAMQVRALGDFYKKKMPAEDHHTIPIYLCGNVDQELSTIDWRSHKLIHWGLGAIWVKIAIAEEAADQVIPLGRRRKDEVMRFAETETGRTVIANLIGQFYQFSGYGMKGTPPIREIFDMEKMPYIKGKTSLPGCKRP